VVLPVAEEWVPLRLGHAPVNLGSQAFYRRLRWGPLTTKVVDRLRLGHFEER
jgi:hypothetical protein